MRLVRPFVCPAPGSARLGHVCMSWSVIGDHMYIDTCIHAFLHPTRTRSIYNTYGMYCMYVLLHTYWYFISLCARAARPGRAAETALARPKTSCLHTGTSHPSGLTREPQPLMYGACQASLGKIALPRDFSYTSRRADRDPLVSQKRVKAPIGPPGECAAVG